MIRWTFEEVDLVAREVASLQKTRLDLSAHKRIELAQYVLPEERRRPILGYQNAPVLKRRVAYFLEEGRVEKKVEEPAKEGLALGWEEHLAQALLQWKKERVSNLRAQELILEKLDTIHALLTNSPLKPIETPRELPVTIGASAPTKPTVHVIGLLDKQREILQEQMGNKVIVHVLDQDKVKMGLGIPLHGPVIVVERFVSHAPLDVLRKTIGKGRLNYWSGGLGQLVDFIEKVVHGQSKGTYSNNGGGEEANR